MNPESQALVVEYLRKLQSKAAEKMKSYPFGERGRDCYEGQVLVLHEAIHGILCDQHIPKKEGKG
jgi:hypothetical protein